VITGKKFFFNLGTINFYSGLSSCSWGALWHLHLRPSFTAPYHFIFLKIYNSGGEGIQLSTFDDIFTKENAK
jgi:hypothetical protein